MVSEIDIWEEFCLAVNFAFCRITMFVWGTIMLDAIFHLIALHCTCSLIFTLSCRHRGIYQGNKGKEALVTFIDNGRDRLSNNSGLNNQLQEVDLTILITEVPDLSDHDLCFFLVNFWVR